MKIIKVGKSQYGGYVQLEDNSYKGVTDQVFNFLKAQTTPFEIEVEASEGTGKYEKISRVKVLKNNNSANEFEKPIETVRPGEDKLITADEAQDSSYWEKKQESIESQMAIKAAIEMIKANNSVDEFDKIKPTLDHIKETALIVKQVLKDIKGK